MQSWKEHGYTNLIWFYFQLQEKPLIREFLCFQRFCNNGNQIKSPVLYQRIKSVSRQAMRFRKLRMKIRNKQWRMKQRFPY
jgi:hypothetical protein